jgi:hypothetical protein
MLHAATALPAVSETHPDAAAAAAAGRTCSLACSTTMARLTSAAVRKRAFMLLPAAQEATAAGHIEYLRRTLCTVLLLHVVLV